MASKIGSWLENARYRITDPTSLELIETEHPGLYAEVLLSDGLNKPRSWILAHPEYELSPQQLKTLEEKLVRYLNSEPLPYILGYWEFFGLRFFVSPSVLIPRPETELLVETAISWLKHHPTPRIADVGTGTGCIAISIAHYIQNTQITAIDISRSALEIAQLNIRQHHADGQISLVQCDLLQPFRGPFDLVCANLPYIPTSILEKLKVRHHEPHQALNGGEDGLNHLRALMENAPRCLSIGGMLLMEIESGQGEAVTAIARKVFPKASIQVIPDLAGNPRLIRVDNA